MKKTLFLTITFILLCYMGFSQNVIDPRLQDVLNQKSEEMIPINIIFKSQIDIAKLRTRVDATLDKKVRRNILVDELKLFSEEKQQEVLSILQAETRSSNVTKIKKHWLANAISCTVSPDVIYLLAEHPDIAIIGYDEMTKMVFDEDIQTTSNGEQTRNADVEVTENILMVNADKVWDMGYTGKGVIVAVIDSGVNYKHVDVADHLWDGGAQYPNHGYNTVDDNYDTMDRYGHGSHCAGTICGDGTSGVLTGIAPDATLMCVKALDDFGSGSTSSINLAMEFAIENHADVLSMSLGILGPSVANKTLLRHTCVNALELGVVASVAAGNFGTNLTPQVQIPNNILAPANCPPPWLHPDQQVNPGALTCVVAVGAVDYSEKMYSNGSKGPVTWTDSEFKDYPYGGDKIGLIRPDVCAPGVAVKSLDHNTNSGHNLKTGTSMAAPCVAGVMALMLEKQNKLTPAEICMSLETTAKKLTETKSNMLGTGLIDAFKAIKSIRTGDLVVNNISINDITTNDNGQINLDEKVKLSINIHNDSDQVYNNIKAVISCSDEAMKITDSEAIIESIDANGDITITDEFEFSVDKSFDYKSVLYVDINFFDASETNIASSSFPIEIKDNDLVLSSFIVKNDNNGNGILEAGETADLGVVLNNNGNEIASKVRGVLSSSDNKVTINQNEAEFSSIGSKSSSIAFFNITISENAGDDLSIPFAIKTEDFFGKEYEFSHEYTSSCNYIFQLKDAYSDGWNGAALLIKYSNNKATDTLTLKSGSMEEIHISIESNVEVTLEWMGKDEYDKECSFVVLTEYQKTIYSSPILSQTSSFLFSWVNDCLCKYEYHEMCEAVNNLSNNSNNISWEQAENTEALHYEIYRNTRFLGTTEELSFVDTTASANTLYCYSVRPVYEDCFGLFKTIDVTYTGESVNENTSDVDVDIYPNPSDKYFTIVCKGMESVTIYNVMGSKVMENKVDNDRCTISGLCPGIYFVNVNSNENKVIKKVIVK